jgi:hypothetical protein
MQRRQFLSKSIALTSGTFGLESPTHLTRKPPTVAENELVATGRRNGGQVFAWRTNEQAWPKTVNPGYQHAPDSAVLPWKDQKFGIRIHWGLYCLIGSDASWALPYSAKEFQDIYGTLYEFFNPTDFDADAYMDLFRRAGAKFFTFTTKHHEGFCMWPTKTIQKSIKRAPDGLSFRPGHKPNFEECTINYSIMETPYPAFPF